MSALKYLLCCPIMIFAFDFMFEQDYIYHLNPSDFHIENNVLKIKPSAINAYKQSAKSLYTDNYKLVFEEGLGYYYYTKRFQHYKEDLLELKKGDDGYYIANFIELKNTNNCYLVAKSIEQKSMKTKSTAMLVNINSIDALAEQKIYFGCLRDNNYIF